MRNVKSVNISVNNYGNVLSATGMECERVPEPDIYQPNLCNNKPITFYLVRQDTTQRLTRATDIFFFF